MSRILVALLCIAVATAQNYRAIGKFSVSSPGFVELKSLTSPSDLVITSFTGNPFAKSAVYVVENVGQYFHNVSDIMPTFLNGTDALAWPNMVEKAPAGIFPGGVSALVVADGFLVPGKDKGGIYLIQFNADGSAQAPFELTTPISGYFYHMVQFVDMNSDGRLDILTARATKPLFGSGSGYLVWLEQPASGQNSQTWTEHILTQGPDVIFTSRVNGKVLEVFAAQFFTNTLSVSTIDLTTGTFLEITTIDNTIGPAYDVNLVSFTQDGKQQLLVTNHSPNQQGSGMFAYDIPADVHGVYNRTIITQGTFPVTEGGFNQAAPGFCYGFYPNTKQTSGRPSILVAGDGAQSAYLFTPTGTDAYSYSMQNVINTGGTVGSLAVGDINGDGWSEFFVPDYDHSTVYVYTFAP